MSIAPAQSSVPVDLASMSVAVVPDGAGVTPARRSSHPKMSVESAWAAWQASGGGSPGSDFLRGVLSWTEGTAAQLLRQAWPAGAKRPTSAEVEERLRHNLELAAHGVHSTYVDGLARARRGVIEELGRARRSAGNNEGGRAQS